MSLPKPHTDILDDFGIWQILFQTALAGTARAELPPFLLDHLAAKGLDIHASREETLLAAAALIRLRILAGKKCNVS